MEVNIDHVAAKKSNYIIPNINKFVPFCQLSLAYIQLTAGQNIISEREALGRSYYA